MSSFEFKELRWKERRFECQGWDFLSQATPYEREQQKLFQEVLIRHAAAEFRGSCFVSEAAQIYTRHFILGDRSFVCGGAIIRHDFEAGEECCIGSYCHIAGTVRLGSDVMMGPGSSIYGFNHGTEAECGITMNHQPCPEKGVKVGNDCWLGAGSIILDGVELGDHCVVAAGAVVTKSFPAWSVLGGVPARLLRSRKQEKVGELIPLTETFEEIPKSASSSNDSKRKSHYMSSRKRSKNNNKPKIFKKHSEARVNQRDEK